MSTSDEVRGRAVVVPGIACFLGYDVKHEILNEGSERASGMNDT